MLASYCFVYYCIHLVVEQLYHIKLDGTLESQLNIKGGEIVVDCLESFVSDSWFTVES